MRIGLDLSCLTGPASGIARATAEMVTAMLDETKGTHEFLGFAPTKLIPKFATLSDRLTKDHTLVCDTPLPLLPARVNKILWVQTTLSARAQQHKIDVLWGPAHRLPFALHSSIARVVTVHDLTYLFYPQTMPRFSLWAERLLLPKALARADKIIAISQSTHDDVAKQFASTRARLVRIPLGVPTLVLPSSLPNQMQDFLQGKKYVLFVGTLEPRKNLPRLLQAYAALPDTVREKTPLILAGSAGWGRENITTHIAALKLEAHVFCTGFVDEAMLSALYHNARVLAMPSLYEGFGLPILESQQCGVPVLTSNTASMPEVAGDAALLVDPTDVKAITDILKLFITNEDLHQSLADKAKANAARFSWTRSAQELLSAFEDANATRHAQNLRAAS